MKVLFNADDFGLTKGVSDGIIKAHKEGVISSTSLMMNGLALHYAISLAKQTPSLAIGIHLVLSSGKPIHEHVPTLINENGHFKYTNNFEAMESPNLEEVEREWRTQINTFLDTGLPLHHINSHHHIHGWPILKPVIKKLSNEYNVPVRYVDSLADTPNLLLTEKSYTHFYGKPIYEDLFSHLKGETANSIEVMTHPGIVDEDLARVSSYRAMREEELTILCSLECPNWVTLL